jgi:hypothetical protein
MDENGNVVQCRDDFSLFEDAGLLTQFHEVKRK